MKMKNENEKTATNLTFIGAFELWLFTSINMLSSAKWSSKQNSVYLGPELIRMKQVQSGLDCLREAQLSNLGFIQITLELCYILYFLFLGSQSRNKALLRPGGIKFKRKLI